MQQKHVFDSWAEQAFWSEEVSAPSSPEELDALDADIRLWVPDFPSLLKGKRVLDLGAGTAPLGTLLAQRYALELVISMDLVFNRLRVAADERREGSPLALVCGDAFCLPFRDRSFDYVLANSVLHHLPNLKQATEEISRVLRTGGWYIGREPNFNNPAVRFSVFKLSGTWVRHGYRISGNEYPLRAQEIVRSFAESNCRCDLHYFWRRMPKLRHPILAVAISVRAQRLSP
jgi:SAM-dependent methyltransferase